MEDRTARNSIRQQRSASLLRDTITRFLQEHTDGSSFITISHVVLNKAGTLATVYCTVFPESKSEQAFGFLSRRTADCRTYIKKHTTLRTVPTIRFTPGVYTDGTGTVAKW